jgi:hypothetical protein
LGGAAVRETDAATQVLFYATASSDGNLHQFPYTVLVDGDKGFSVNMPRSK